MPQFVIVGGGRLATSSDGITWTGGGIGSGVGSTEAKICYSTVDKKYLLGGTAQLWTSTDLVTFTTRTSAFANFVRGVAASPTAGYVAGDTDGRLGSSPDAVTWTNRGTTITGSNPVQTAIWVDGLNIFAVGCAANARIHTSSDGATWSANRLGLDSGGVHGFCWSPDLGLMVWVGSWSGNARIETSTDGVTFTPRTTPFGTSIVTGCAWSPSLGLFCAVAQAGKIATSPDGITWTSRTSGIATALNDVEWGSDAGVFVAGGTGGVLLTSSDGITWTSRTPGFSTTDINDVLWVSAVLGAWRVGMVL